MAKCIKHNREKTLTGRFRTTRKVYSFTACDACYKTTDTVRAALNNLVYELKLRKQ